MRTTRDKALCTKVDQRVAGNQKSGGEASNSNGWLGGARGERHPQSGETRHCRFGTHCKYMHKYCPFVHVHTDGGKGQVSPTKVENYWSALRGRDERNSLRPKRDSHSAERGTHPRSPWGPALAGQDLEVRTLPYPWSNNTPGKGKEAKEWSWKDHRLWCERVWEEGPEKARLREVSERSPGAIHQKWNS